VHISIFRLILLSALLQAIPHACLAFDLKEQEQSLHGSIIEDSLSSTFADDNLKLIIKSCDQADDADMLFRKNTFKRSLSYIEREQKKTLNAAFDADRNPSDRYRALKHFGYMLRATQDFYSNSNYVELQVNRLTQKLGANNFDPYTIELVDWTKESGLTQSNSAVTEADKKKNNAEQGQEKIGQSTYYKTARELALRESARQWDIVCKLISRKYPERAALIITALREASVPEKETEEF